MNIKKFALHEGIKFKEITLTREDDFSTIYLSFSSAEEKEQKFSQSLLNIDGILEIKIE